MKTLHKPYGMPLKAIIISALVLLVAGLYFIISALEQAR